MKIIYNQIVGFPQNLDVVMYKWSYGNFKKWSKSHNLILALVLQRSKMIITNFRKGHQKCKMQTEGRVCREGQYPEICFWDRVQQLILGMSSGFWALAGIMLVFLRKQWSKMCSNAEKTDLNYISVLENVRWAKGC